MKETMSRSDDPSRPSGGPSAQSNPPQTFLDWVRELLHWKPAASIREELEGALSSESSELLEFSPEERALLKNILGLSAIKVDDVMVPRADIIAVHEETTLCDLLKRFAEAEHSRLPVYGETLDDLRGMVHIKDLMRHLTVNAGDPAGLDYHLDLTRIDLQRPLNSTDLVRQVLYVPPSMPAAGLLARMQASHIHMALVIDEHGGTDGLITIEDVVEIVVGDIEDEHDETEEPLIHSTWDGGFVADARIKLDDIRETFALTGDLGEAAEEVDTLGGFLVNLAGRVPVAGDRVEGPQDLEFEILEADPRRVKKVRIMRHGLDENDVEPTKQRAEG